MIVLIKQKQPSLTTSIVKAITYTQGGCMITIGKIPKKLQSFFRPVKKQVSEHVYLVYGTVYMCQPWQYYR